MVSCVSVCGHNYNKHVDGELCVCLSVDTTTINMCMVSCVSVCGHNYNKHVDGELCVCLWTQLRGTHGVWFITPPVGGHSAH
jgi:hypothetical protein